MKTLSHCRPTLRTVQTLQHLCWNLANTAIYGVSISAQICLAHLMISTWRPVAPSTGPTWTYPGVFCYCIDVFMMCVLSHLNKDYLLTYLMLCSWSKTTWFWFQPAHEKSATNSYFFVRNWLKHALRPSFRRAFDQHKKSYRLERLMEWVCI